MRPVALDLDGVLADTRPLWDAWLESASGVLAVDPAELPRDRGAAARMLDETGGGNWRTLLERFAEERVAVYVRRDARTGGALRALDTRGAAIGVYTDAPEPLARVVLRHLGAERRVVALEAGPDALERLQARLGDGALVLRGHDELRALAAAP